MEDIEVGSKVKLVQLVRQAHESNEEFAGVLRLYGEFVGNTSNVTNVSGDAYGVRFTSADGEEEYFDVHGNEIELVEE